MDTLIYYVVDGLTIIIVTTLFEYIKALMSTIQGDEMPKSQGKLTLNPVKHFEPIGFILFIYSGFGWANPVETSSRNYKDRKRGIMVTYITPIVLSLVLAVVIKLAMNLLILGGIDNEYISLALALLSRNFAAVGVFNIIPVYPMAGSWVLRCVLNPNNAIKYSQYEKPLQILLIFLLVLGVLTPVLNFVVELIV